jgi:hypothetical protein
LISTVADILLSGARLDVVLIGYELRPGQVGFCIDQILEPYFIELHQRIDVGFGPLEQGQLNAGILRVEVSVGRVEQYSPFRFGHALNRQICTGFGKAVSIQTLVMNVELLGGLKPELPSLAVQHTHPLGTGQRS